MVFWKSTLGILAKTSIVVGDYMEKIMIRWHRLKRFALSELLFLFVKNRKWNQGADCVWFMRTLPTRWRIFQKYNQLVSQIMMQ